MIFSAPQTHINMRVEMRINVSLTYRNNKTQFVNSEKEAASKTHKKDSET